MARILGLKVLLVLLTAVVATYEQANIARRKRAEFKRHSGPTSAVITIGKKGGRKTKKVKGDSDTISELQDEQKAIKDEIKKNKTKQKTIRDYIKDLLEIWRKHLK